MGYKILRSHSPEEFFIALAIGLLLKLNTVINDHEDNVSFFKTIFFPAYMDIEINELLWNRCNIIYGTGTFCVIQVWAGQYHSCWCPAGFIAIREMSGRNKISQGQGIVREFYSVREILTFGKIDEKRHGISVNVRENDHFGQHDSPVSTYIDQLAKSRLRNFIK